MLADDRASKHEWSGWENKSDGGGNPGLAGHGRGFGFSSG